MGPDAVVLKCDFQNAFNERKREQILQELFCQDRLRPLWRLSHWAYKASSELLVMDNGAICMTIDSEQGVKQGDGLGSLLFSLSVQGVYRRVTRNVNNVRCVAVADDLNLVGLQQKFFACSMTSQWIFVALGFAFAIPSVDCSGHIRESFPPASTQP